MIDRHNYRLDIAEGSVPDISKESTELKLQGAQYYIYSNNRNCRCTQWYTY